MPNRCLMCGAKQLSLQTKFCLSCLASRGATKDEIELLTMKFQGKSQIENSLDGIVRVKIV